MASLDNVKLTPSIMLISQDHRNYTLWGTVTEEYYDVVLKSNYNSIINICENNDLVKKNVFCY